MNIAALIPMLIPLLGSFLKGKSGNELSGMLSSNSGQITDILTQVLGSAGGGLGGGDLSAVAGLLGKQQVNPNPVIIMPEGMTAVTPKGMTAVTAAKGAGEPVNITPLDNELLDEIKARLEKLEHKVEDEHKFDEE